MQNMNCNFKGVYVTNIVWLRDDLRLQDNPALQSACDRGETIAIYIKEPNDTKTEARDWWLHHSLNKLQTALKNVGVPLVFAEGNACNILPQFIEEQNASAIFWNRRYTEKGIKTDGEIKTKYKDSKVLCQSCMGNLLFEPWEIKNKQGGFFKVFTPMFKELLTLKTPKPVPFTQPKEMRERVQSTLTCTLEELNLINSNKIWHKSFEPHWEIGEAAAEIKLQKFLEEKITHYKKGRDFMSDNSTSTLSPHLHFGEISPRTIFDEIEAFALSNNLENHEGIQCFKSEIVWREFSYQQLFHYEQIEQKPINEKFKGFPWELDAEKFTAWKKGLTGIPIVDAGMRELWQTGIMHNRVRMIVASLLTKNLLIPWQEGAKWFMDTLVDADEAANSANWQWVAGCGLDASPYFRIFNPVTQGEKFDTDGTYVKKWVPELQDLDKKYIHQPWEASEFDLKLAGVELGKNYPKPIINLKASRERALEAYAFVKNQA